MRETCLVGTGSVFSIHPPFTYPSQGEESQPLSHLRQVSIALGNIATFPHPASLLGNIQKFAKSNRLPHTVHYCTRAHPYPHPLPQYSIYLGNTQINGLPNRLFRHPSPTPRPSWVCIPEAICAMRLVWNWFLCKAFHHHLKKDGPFGKHLHAEHLNFCD
jgi:hypothetical protein